MLYYNFKAISLICMIILYKNNVYTNIRNVCGRVSRYKKIVVFIANNSKYKYFF